MNACTNAGRYCSDSIFDVTEILRRECIWSIYGQDENGLPWIDYVLKYNRHCDNLANEFQKRDCVKAILPSIAMDSTLIDYCIDITSGGLEKTSHQRNTMLDEIIRSAKEMHITSDDIPVLIINGQRVQGGLAVTTGLTVVCAPFLENQSQDIPSICSSCTMCSNPHACIIQRGVCDDDIEYKKSSSKNDTDTEEPVQYTIWTVPQNPEGAQLLEQFAPIAQLLGNRAKFTPRMYVVDGIENGCFTSSNTDVAAPVTCENRCILDGRYCGENAVVVEETVRWACIWKVFGSEDSIGIRWWNYVNTYHKRCDAVCDVDVKMFNSTELAQIESCIENYAENDRVHEELQNLIVAIQEEEAVIDEIPVLLINGVKVQSGGTVDVAFVLASICSRFEEKPRLCLDCVHCPDILDCIFQAKCLQPAEAVASGYVTAKHSGESDSEAGKKDGSGRLSVLAMIRNRLIGHTSCISNLDEFVSEIDRITKTENKTTIPELLSELSAQIPEASICSEVDASHLASSLQRFDSCAGWKAQNLIVNFPTITASALLRCLDVVAQRDGPIADPDDCLDILFGGSPLGDSFRNLYLYPGKACPCLQALAMDIPRCALHLLPSPIPGSWIQETSCLLFDFICGDFLDKFCSRELESLNNCLPLPGEVVGCSDVLNCTFAAESFSLSLPKARLGVPLPDACNEVFRKRERTALAGTDILERYDKFVGECAEEYFWGSRNQSLATSVHSSFHKEDMDKKGASPSLRFGLTSTGLLLVILAVAAFAASTYRRLKDDNWMRPQGYQVIELT